MPKVDFDLKRLQSALRDLRVTKRRGESVRQFALNAGISPSHVALMEGRKKKHLKLGSESSPTVFMLHRYLRHCGSSLTQFFATFEREHPADLTPEQKELVDSVCALLSAGDDVERRLRERIDDVRAWLVTQEEMPRAGKLKKKKAG